MAIPARSDFYVIPQFPEVYHGQEVSEALFSAAARRVTGQGRDTTSSVIVSQEHRYILCCRAAARRSRSGRSGTSFFGSAMKKSEGNQKLYFDYRKILV